MNKYQIALNNFKAYKKICTHEHFDRDIEALQELIDNYSKYEKALDKACDTIYQFDKQLNDEFGGGLGKSGY